MATLQDYLKGINTGYKPWTLPQIPQTPLFTTTTQTLPNAGGTYKSVAPVTPQPITPQPATIPTKPIAPASPATTQLDYSRYTDPATGRVMSPQEYAASLAARVSSQRTAGDVPTYAGNVLTQGPQSTGQLQMTAAQLNNTRNDLATGTTDPYAVGNRSGVAYSPAELAAIEKAYAGIYDPAINSALAKLDAKQKEDAANLDFQKQVLLRQMPQTTAGPTSYQEWTLAGEPGTYADYLKSSNVKAPTTAQQTVAEYAARIEQAIPTIEKVQDEINKMSYLDFTFQLKMPAALQNSTIQQYVQAASNFINAKLRRESGAVISPTEFTEARTQYLPQPGDDVKTTALKKANRDLVFASLRNAAGSAYQSVNDLMAITNSLNTPTVTADERAYLKSQGVSDEEINKLK